MTKNKNKNINPIARTGLLVLAMVLFLLIPTSCGSQNNEDETRFVLESDCPYLYDFHYLIRLMEDTFPHFGVVYRNFGVDVRQLADEAMERIANHPGMDDNILFDEIADLFIPLLPVVHAQPLFYQTFPLWKYRFGGAGVGQLISEGSAFNANTFNNVRSIEFYERQRQAGWDMTPQTEEAFALRPAIHTDLDNFPVQPAWNRIAATYIIEEGRIAYMNIPTFMHHGAGGIERGSLFNFYTEIQDYEHLIIDIRNNGGGYTFFWENNIMLPLSNNAPVVPIYNFFPQSERGLKFAQIFADDHYQKGIGADLVTSESFSANYAYPISISEFLNDRQFPYLNQSDLQYLGYVVPLTQSVRNLNPMWYVPEIPFHGQIWLLINPVNASSASMFARHAKDSGFATLVGEQTGGHFGAGTLRIFFPLPNTGIIVTWDVGYKTDQYGRSWEEFRVMPHHQNMPGMDALETVLFLINEGY
ncbi:MAG: S41 family peptidase [Defluviitaleaceae bacterium]|nr:S41 family peptidase [Defluviitaleaceae bacterium]